MALKTKIVMRRVVDPAALYADIGRRMRLARERAGVTQREVGFAIGMSGANVANLEAGKTRILLDHIYNAALLLDIPVQKLLP